MFAIKKKTKEGEPQQYRPIIILKRLNYFIRNEHFEIENLDLARFILRKGDWMAKVDLKVAYLVVPICEDHQKFVRFVWKGNFYQIRGLSFGLSSAPWVFTKIMKLVVASLR